MLLLEKLGRKDVFVGVFGMKNKSVFQRKKMHIMIFMRRCS
jgi:hypothetical protein